MKITEKVFQLDSTKGSYCYLVDDNGWVLIDTGLAFAGRGIEKELESMGISPAEIKHILLTHHDADHVGNLKRLKDLSGAKVWAHQKDIPYITGEKERPGFKKYIGKLAKKNQIKKIEPYPHERRIGNIEILFTPGHSPGHVCMLFEGVFFAGDLVEYKKGKIIPYPNFWNWNTEMMIESIEQLKDLKFMWLCPAHGTPVRSRTLLGTPGN